MINKIFFIAILAIIFSSNIYANKYIYSLNKENTIDSTNLIPVNSFSNKKSTKSHTKLLSSNIDKKHNHGVIDILNNDDKALIFIYIENENIDMNAGMVLLYINNYNYYSMYVYSAENKYVCITPEILLYLYNYDKIKLGIFTNKGIKTFYFNTSKFLGKNK